MSIQKLFWTALKELGKDFRDDPGNPGNCLLYIGIIVGISAGEWMWTLVAVGGLFSLTLLCIMADLRWPEKALTPEQLPKDPRYQDLDKKSKYF